MRFEEYAEPAWTRSIHFLDAGAEDIEEARDIIQQWVDLAYERIKPQPGEIGWRSTGQVLTWTEDVMTPFTGEHHAAGHSWSPSRDTDACPICGETTRHTRYYE